MTNTRETLLALFASYADANVAAKEAFGLPRSVRKQAVCIECAKMAIKNGAYNPGVIFHDANAIFDPVLGEWVTVGDQGDVLDDAHCSECGERSWGSEIRWVPVTWKFGDPLPPDDFDPSNRA